MKTAEFERKSTDFDTQEDFAPAFTNSGKSPLRVLLSIFKGNYGILLKSVFFYLLQISPTLALPVVTANIINIATYPQEHSTQELVFNVVIMSFLILQNIISTYLSTNYRSIANRRVELALRSSMVRKLQQLSISFQKEMKSGKIQSKIMRDVDNIGGLSHTLFTSTISITFSLSTAIFITISKSPVVFVFFLISVPAALIIMRLFKGRIRKSNSEFRQQVENASAQVSEMVEMLPVTKAHALEEPALDRINVSLYRMIRSAHVMDQVNALFGATSWVTFQIFQLLCLAFTGYLAYRQMIPVGDIAMYQSYFASIVSAISSIIALLPTITAGFESVRSVGEIMWAMDEERNSNKEKISSLQGSYEFRDVRFHYPDDSHPVLNGLNLKVEKGETVALVGESGSGKSTVLNMLIGFYHPSSGTVLVDGKDMNDLDLHVYRSHIATVPQTSVLFSGTIRENIVFGMENCTQEQIDEAIHIANLENVIAKLPQGLDTNVGEHGDKLSGGQRQRIAIARAVIRNASVIIFDEATSALDTVSEKLIQESLDRLAENRTTFIVAHRLSTIRNADKIAVIKDGKCVEFGTWDELMALGGEFYKFRNMQA